MISPLTPARSLGWSLLLPVFGRRMLVATISSLRLIDDALIPLDDDA